MSVQKHKVAGFKLTKEDTPYVIGSITCFAAYSIYGACTSALAAAIPQIADALDMSTADFGFSYSTRGVGYLIGTLLAAYCLNRPDFTLNKIFLTSACLSISGVTFIIIAISNSFIVMLVFFFIQGLGFGGVDMMANCALPEMWGLRVQPWMQAMHAGNTFLHFSSNLFLILLSTIIFRLWNWFYCWACISGSNSI